jgi:hypothetical protein
MTFSYAFDSPNAFCEAARPNEEVETRVDRHWLPLQMNIK